MNPDPPWVLSECFLRHGASLQQSGSLASALAICHARFPLISTDFIRFLALIWAELGYVLVRVDFHLDGDKPEAGEAQKTQQTALVRNLRAFLDES